MKIYPNIVSAIVSALDDIFNQNAQADKVVEALLKSNAKWGSRDRRFIADNIYSVVRWYRLYYEILGHPPQATRDWWKILGIHWILQGEDITGIEELKHLRSEQIVSKKKELEVLRKIRESYPDWLDELAAKELGNDWEHISNALNKPQQVCLRVNLLKSTSLNLQKTLSLEGIETDVLSPSALVVKKRARLTHLCSYQDGLFEIQDYNSQLIAPFLELEAGQKVVDACAGAGGKTLQMADLMENKGEIIALDVHDYKLKELAKRALRAGINIIHSKTIQSPEVISKLKEYADRLLLDVPCTGFGVLRRNPDAKWKLNREFLDEIRVTQQNILQNYSSMLKPGGKMVYATCSILPSENQNQIHTFLKSALGKNFALIKQQTTLPSITGFDGFYMALLEKST